VGRSRRRALIRAPSEDELPAIAAFVAALQAQPEHRIAYFGDTTDEVAALLESWALPWSDSSRVVERDGQLIGFVAADLDKTLGRAWIHGPYISEVTRWDELADALLDELMAAAAPIADFEVVGDVANTRLADLARRAGFTSGPVNYTLALAASRIDSLPPAASQRLRAEHEDAFAVLHDELFPGTYYPGFLLLERAARGQAVIETIVDSTGLVAYAAGQIDEGGAGYIDFVGVAVDRRREGHGQAVVAAISRSLAALRPIPQIRLTVSSTNETALALYDSLGFERSASMVGYRRRPGAAA
jgi:ribosomal protein S18 acetylase RimI-like enzyme